LAPDADLQETVGLPEALAADAAALAYAAFEDFYSLFSGDRERVLAAVARQFLSPSELNQLVAAFEAGRLVGIASYYELGEMRERQMEGARSLFAIAEDTRATAAALRAFGRNFPATAPEGGYIARFAVAADRRGSGLAARLLAAVESAITRRGWTPVQLHVRRDNARALAFYAKCGYVATGPLDLGYRLLTKHAAR